jgi:hypothetical protein
MGNIDKKKDNDNLRDFRERIDTLSKVIDTKNEIVEVIPEMGLIEKYRAQDNVVVLENEELSNLIEQIASLQFAGKKTEEICKLLEIDQKTLKSAVLTEEFSDVKKRLAEDQKTYLLSKVLLQVDGAMKKLGELVKVADEDKTSLNAIALVLEQANRLLADQQGNYGNQLGGLIRGATKNGDEVQVSLAHIIMKKRAERGLKD